MTTQAQLPPLIAVEQLSVSFPTPEGMIMATNGVSFEVRRGQTLGVVGESGSGKSMTLRAICGLVPSPGRVISGSIAVEGRPCSWTDVDALRSITSMVFQDPTSSLNPVRTVGSQIVEVLRVLRGMSRQAAGVEALELLDHVGIPDPRRRISAYPHQLSGGMRQRVMIALALATAPRLLLADEPTTALDVTTQEQILALLQDLQAETGMAMVFVTHDLGVAREICDDMVVMYASYVMERGPVKEVTAHPRHPYTHGLIGAVPELDAHGRVTGIPGQPPNMAMLPPGCPFAPRCRYVTAKCAEIDMDRESQKRCACPFDPLGAADGVLLGDRHAEKGAR
jgi:oligopeptide/dipeptide ABC transporter ATP-binding protein